MAEENQQNTRIYIIPDMCSLTMSSEYEKPTPIEYYDSFAEAKKRFNELRNQPYNSETALSYNGMPSARLTLGIESGSIVTDILQVRGGVNTLVDDFIRMAGISEDKNVLSVIRQTAAEIGFDKVNSFPVLENGQYGEMVTVPFKEWAAENTQYNLTGGIKKMEHNTTFDVSSISKIDNGSNVKALASVVINGELAIRGVKVMEGEKGPFVAMPSKKVGMEYSDIAFPITAEVKAQFDKAVMEKYGELMMSAEKTLKSDAPVAEQSTSSVKVSLRPIESNSALKAAGQITIDNCFVVKDVKVLESSDKKPFVAMPSYQTQTGDYAQYALPITKDMREKLDKMVLGTFQSLGKVEYTGVKYAELGGKDEIAHLNNQNNTFAKALMAKLDEAGVKYQARIEGTTSISVNKADKPKLDYIKNELVKELNTEKQQTTSAPKFKR